MCGLCIVLGALVPFFAYLPVFAIGMAAYQNKDRILKWMRGKRILLAFLAFVLIDFSYISKWLGWEIASSIQNNVTAIGAAVMLLCVYELTVNRSCIGRAIGALGDCSYHIYLVHMPVLIWFRFLCGKCGFGGYAFTTICVTCILAAALYKADGWMHQVIPKQIASK